MRSGAAHHVHPVLLQYDFAQIRVTVTIFYMLFYIYIVVTGRVT